jgi:hypothetical protein
MCITLLCGAATGIAVVRGRQKLPAATLPPTPLVSAPPPVDVPTTPTAIAPALEHAVTPQPTHPPQVNIGILIIDSFNSPTPVLQAVWIAALQTDLQTAYMLGLSPFAWVKLDSGAEVRLRDTYIFDPATGSGGPGFEAALAEVAAVPPVGTITLDAPLLAEIVNQVGGVDLAGTRMDGAGSVAYALSAAPNDPFAQSAYQVEFVSALRYTATIKMVDLPIYVDLVTQRGRSTMPTESLRTLAAAFQGYNPAGLGIAPPVPDPQLIIIAPDGQPAVLLSRDLSQYPDTAATAP